MICSILSAAKIMGIRASNFAASPKPYRRPFTQGPVFTLDGDDRSGVVERDRLAELCSARHQMLLLGESRSSAS